jgi:glycosyltransferase involved in cell wall biosynthesis
MKILYLAPQPLYQDRGTSIANRLIIEVLSQRGEQVDVVTYHEGQTVEFEHITLHRIPNLPFVRGIRPGFSWKKIICDLFMLPIALRLSLKNAYHVVHAVEEAVFIAMLLKIFFRTPYVYDMDSSLAQQMVEKYPRLKILSRVLNFFEGLAIRHARAVIVVCDALGDIARQHDPAKIVTLRDVPLLDEEAYIEKEDLRAHLGISGPVVMYVGNLERYQGIDLLLESFALVHGQGRPADLVIIGGAAADIEKYSQKCRELRIHERAHFTGPRPLAGLFMYLQQADILVSPRLKGQNTPMKIYSYLYSGVACLVTDLWSHTQVLNDSVAVLTQPVPDAFAEGMVRLLEDETLRERLGQAGVQLIEEKYDYSVFLQNLNELLDWLKQETNPEASLSAQG